MPLGRYYNTKNNQKDDIRKAGRWSEFVEIREGLKTDGMNDNEAFDEAVKILNKATDIVTDRAIAVDRKGRVSKATFNGKACSTQKSVMWVAKNIAVSDTIPEDAPSAEAWGMLSWSQKTSNNEREFWTSIYPKLLPTRTQLDSEARFTDDGRTAIAIIDRVIAAAKAAKELTNDD